MKDKETACNTKILWRISNDIVKDMKNYKKDELAIDEGKTFVTMQGMTNFIFFHPWNCLIFHIFWNDRDCSRDWWKKFIFKCRETKNGSSISFFKLLKASTSQASNHADIYNIYIHTSTRRVHAQQILKISYSIGARIAFVFSLGMSFLEKNFFLFTQQNIFYTIFENCEGGRDLWCGLSMSDIILYFFCHVGNALCQKKKSCQAWVDFAANIVAEFSHFSKILPVTMLMSSSWLRWLEDDSERLELAELNGWSDGHGDGGPFVIKRANVR